MLILPFVTQELGTFCKHVMRKFFEVAEKNPKVFVELFFWKTYKDSLEVVEGYGSTRLRYDRLTFFKTAGKRLLHIELQEIF